MLGRLQNKVQRIDSKNTITIFLKRAPMVLTGHYWKLEPANISSMAADRQTLVERCDA